MSRKVRCSIEKCNSYIEYQHLKLCKTHYNKLLGLGWKNPSRSINSQEAKVLVEQHMKYGGLK